MKLPFSLFLLILCIALIYSSFVAPLCLENERIVLLQFKLNLSINQFASTYPSAYPKTETWKVVGNESDCCLWDGIECSEKSNHVISLDLSSSYLYGSINVNNTLFELVHLQTLDLSNNDFRHSSIPSKINHLPSLKYLNLSHSMFSGQIPTEIYQLSNLISLDLSHNVDPLSGAKLLNLELLSLKSLVQSFPNLQVLKLNQVSISFRASKVLANFTSLRLISLSDCGLHGAFPKDFGMFLKLERLQFLGLSGVDLILPTKTEKHNSSHQFWVLSLLTCNLIQFPNFLQNQTKLEMLSLENNRIRGSIHIPTPSLMNYDVSDNELSGEIPPLICNLTSLHRLFLGYNKLSGALPPCFGDLSNSLSILQLQGNNFWGAIPKTFTTKCQLKWIILSSNQF
ncbi:hypothetical protein Ancab_040498 [Ancistrocladus abbreviatus]